MNISNIVRVLHYNHPEQLVECMIRDGNVLRREWIPMAYLYFDNQLKNGQLAVRGR